MQRLFQEHQLRRVKSLDGTWQLMPQDQSDRTFFTQVPGVWETIPALTRYRGICVYRRMVHIPAAGNYLLKFGGASHTAHVRWDGQPVGEHYNAFTGFQILLTGVQPGEHELSVEVDNRFTEESALHVPNDYVTYGGLNRPAELHAVGSVLIDRMAFHATESADGTFDAHVRVFVTAMADADDLEIAVTAAHGEAKTHIQALHAGETASAEVTIPSLAVKKWDVHAGNLYFLKATLSMNGEAVDDLIDRVGFRTVRVEGESILLNGKRLRIKGFNRHEDHGQFGVSMPVEAMMADLQLMLDMGGNSIRTCHYPNDPRFLDLCDELGIPVWEEHHARALPEPVFHSELFAKQCAACNEEMVTQHVNHPAIYVWGLLNECESETEFGRGVYSTQIAQLRALDPTRPITFASCRHFRDICLDLVDIVSFNMYPGWYMPETTDEFVEKLTQWLEENGAKGKPIIISEIGAGAIYNYHDPLGRAKWSEERQADLLREELTSVHGNPRFSGSYIWQFADVRVSEEWAMRRPKTVNNKGIVDMYRRPKMSYAVVKEIYSKL